MNCVRRHRSEKARSHISLPIFLHFFVVVLLLLYVWWKDMWINRIMMCIDFWQPLYHNVLQFILIFLFAHSHIYLLDKNLNLHLTHYSNYSSHTSIVCIRWAFIWIVGCWLHWIVISFPFDGFGGWFCLHSIEFHVNSEMTPMKQFFGCFVSSFFLFFCIFACHFMRLSCIKIKIASIVRHAYSMFRDTFSQNEKRKKKNEKWIKNWGWTWLSNLCRIIVKD